MMRETFTIIDDGRVTLVEAAVASDGVRLSPAALRAAVGWELKAQGLCRGDRCLAIGGGDLVTTDGIDLVGLAALLGRPLAIDATERVAYLGVAAAQRGAQLASLEAPEFTLPDLNGSLHTLSDYRGRKVLLVAYASW